MSLRTLLCASAEELWIWQHRLVLAGVEVLGVAETGGDALACYRMHRPDRVLLIGDLDGCQGVRIAAVLVQDRPQPILIICDDGQRIKTEDDLRRRGLSPWVRVVERSTVEVAETRAEPAKRSSVESKGRGDLRAAISGVDATVVLGSSGAGLILPNLVANLRSRSVPIVVAMHHNPDWQVTFRTWVGELMGMTPHRFCPSNPELEAGTLYVAAAEESEGTGPNLDAVVDSLLQRDRRLLVCLTSGAGGVSLETLATVRRRGGVVVGLLPDQCPQPMLVRTAMDAGELDATLSIPVCRVHLAMAG